MRIGLEVSSVLAPRYTGVQRYVCELVRALSRAGQEHAFSLWLRRSDRRKRAYLPALGLPVTWYVHGLLAFQPRVDLFHGLSGTTPRGLAKVARVATLHDVFALVLPGYGSRRTLRRYRRIASADRIIAVSEATRSAFLAHFPQAEGRVDVVHHGVSSAFFEPVTVPPRLERPYLVAFSGAARKNLARVMEAFDRCAFGKDGCLLVIGPRGQEDEKVLQGLDRTDRIRFIDRLPDAEMAAVYRWSSGLVFPSLAEGFGLPILEAMAVGAPVLTADRGATAEVAAGHAVLVDPESVESIAAGIDRLVELPEAARSAAQAHARTFTWERCARETIAVYRTLF